MHRLHQNFPDALGARLGKDEARRRGPVAKNAVDQSKSPRYDAAADRKALDAKSAGTEPPEERP